MNDEIPLSHDQLVARVQAFYDHLRDNFEQIKTEYQKYSADDESEEKMILRCKYDEAAELLDLYTHTFESVVYTWIY